MTLQWHSVQVVTLPVSARWLVKHWDRADVPRPPQQPGDPQVKTEPRRGVNWPSPLQQGGRLKPPRPASHLHVVADSSSPAQPCPGPNHLFMFSLGHEAAASSDPPPSFSPPSTEKNIWFPLRSKQTQLQPQQHLQRFRSRGRWRSLRALRLLFCLLSPGMSDEINSPGRGSVWRMSSRMGSLWNAALQQNSAAAPFVEKLTLLESLGRQCRVARGAERNHQWHQQQREFRQVSSTHSSPHILRLCHVSGANWVSSACLKGQPSHLHWGVQAAAQERPWNTQSASITCDKRSAPDSL